MLLSDVQQIETVTYISTFLDYFLIYSIDTLLQRTGLEIHYQRMHCFYAWTIFKNGQFFIFFSLQLVYLLKSYQLIYNQSLFQQFSQSIFEHIYKQTTVYLLPYLSWRLRNGTQRSFQYDTLDFHQVNWRHTEEIFPRLPHPSLSALQLLQKGWSLRHKVELLTAEN